MRGHKWPDIAKCSLLASSAGGFECCPVPAFETSVLAQHQPLRQQCFFEIRLAVLMIPRTCLWLLGGALWDFQFCYCNCSFLPYIAFGRIWQHGKYSYGTCRWFAYNSCNFQTWPNIEKCWDIYTYVWNQIQPNINFQPNNGICIPKTKENLRKTVKRKPTAPPVWAWDPGPGPGLPGPRPWGCCRLAFYCFSLVFLCFWYVYCMPLLGWKLILGWI